MSPPTTGPAVEVGYPYYPEPEDDSAVVAARCRGRGEEGEAGGEGEAGEALRGLVSLVSGALGVWCAAPGLLLCGSAPGMVVT